MAKVLIVDDEQDIRDLLVDTLFDAGYEVIEAKNGSSAIDKACLELPDLILLDVWMPVMDGFEALQKLRENPTTEAIPVILLTALPQSQGSKPSWELGVRHYIEKPFDSDHVLLAVKVALREAGTEPDEVTDCHTAKVWQGSTPNRKNFAERQAAIRTGNDQLDRILGGGINLGSLTLVEGTPSSGASVLCQHIAYESLVHGHGVAFFTASDTANGLIKQMASIGMDVSNYRRGDKLLINPLEEPRIDDDCEFSEKPEQLMASLVLQMQRVPSQNEIIVVDAITNLVSNSEDRSVLRFFSSCKRLCADDRTIILVAHSYAFDENLIRRISDLCDAHFKLSLEDFGGKLCTALEVSKSHNAEQAMGNTITFQVEPGIGMRALPFSKVKV